MDTLVALVNAHSVDDCQTAFALKGVPVSEKLIFKWRSMMINSNQDTTSVASAINDHTASFLTERDDATEATELLDRPPNASCFSRLRQLVSCSSCRPSKSKAMNKSV